MQTTYVSFSKSGTSATTYAQKASLEVKEEWCQEMLYPQSFAVESIFTKMCMCTQERSLRYTKYGLCTRQIKMIGQRKPERNAPYKLFKLPQRCDLGTLVLSLPVYLSTCTISSSLLINTSILHCFSYLWKYFSAKSKVQGPCHWPLV